MAFYFLGKQRKSSAMAADRINRSPFKMQNSSNAAGGDKTGYRWTDLSTKLMTNTTPRVVLKISNLTFFL